MFRWKTWAMIPRMFHEENIVFQTCRTAVFRRKVGLTVVLRWSYGGLMIQVTEKRLELSANKGIKKVRETSDIVRVPTENTKSTKTRMHMKLDYKSQQITQITQIIESVKSVKSVDKYIKQKKTKKNTKKIRAIREIRWQQKNNK